ncbi:MAG: DUF86 domain-containing protein [Bacillota bacterium]|nr:DUF86 domain-containing protein [Bacillota bacterium]
MNSRDLQFIRKIISEIDVANGFIDDMSYDEFAGDELIRRAVCMTLINIGELVKGLSGELRTANPHIPWRSISGLRDLAAHKYQTLRMDDVWKTLRDDLTPLKAELEKMSE